MKQLLIIVPGSKNKHLPFFQCILDRIYSYFGVELGNEDWTPELKHHIESPNLDVEVFHWSGGISERYSLCPAAKQLSKFIKQRQQKYSRICILGKSLGGVVAELALRDSEAVVSKLIYVATPHRRGKIVVSQDTTLINIFSPQDTYLSLANKILYFGLGKKVLSNAENISIYNVQHSQFNHNIKVLYKKQEMKLFDVYKQLIIREY